MGQSNILSAFVSTTHPMYVSYAYVMHVALKRQDTTTAYSHTHTHTTCSFWIWFLVVCLFVCLSWCAHAINYWCTGIICGWALFWRKWVGRKELKLIEDLTNKRCTIRCSPWIGGLFPESLRWLLKSLVVVPDLFFGMCFLDLINNHQRHFPSMLYNMSTPNYLSVILCQSLDSVKKAKSLATNQFTSTNKTSLN